MIIQTVDLQISGSNSILSFETDGGGSWEVWDRYLAIDGNKAFHIGNICGTCSFFFERLEGANQKIEPKVMIAALNDGIKGFDELSLDDLGRIIPDGKYIVTLYQVTPRLIEPSDEDDYFSKEQVDLWGIDSFIGKPHSPMTEYFRLTTSKLNNSEGLFEFLIPTFPHNWLNKSRVSSYRESIKNGSKPTMVAISVLDVKEPADGENEIDITSHWCLAHYVVDGHHKAYAAALENQPITLISFLAVEKGVSSEADIQTLLTQLTSKPTKKR